jgi:hypothetical protein
MTWLRLGLLLAVASLLSVGCVTVEEIRSATPTETRVYAGDVDSFETCMLTRHSVVTGYGILGGTVYLRSTGERKKGEFAELEVQQVGAMGETRTISLLTARRLDDKHFVVEFRKGYADWRKELWPLVEDCAGAPVSQ